MATISPSCSCSIMYMEKVVRFSECVLIDSYMKTHTCDIMLYQELSYISYLSCDSHTTNVTLELIISSHNDLLHNIVIILTS